MSKRARVRVTRELPGQVMQALRGAHDVVVSADLRELADVEAVISQLTEPIDAALLARAPHLRVLGNYAVGVDNIDVRAATARGIPVVNTPGVLTDATADFTMALLLAAARRVVEGDAVVRAGGFRGWSHDLLPGTELAGKRLGIVGFGRIGTAVARRAAGFGLELVYTSSGGVRHPGSRTERDDAGLGARRLPLPELLSTSDFVTLHLPLSPSSHHLIGEAELRAMKPTAILVNAARGPLVDEAALVRALDEGWIAAAGLDVFEREPEVEPGLLRQPRAVLAPHLGSATVETRARMADLVCQGVLTALAGGRPPNVVNPEVWA